MANTTERRVILVDVKGSQAAVKHMRELQKAAKNVDTNIGRMGKTLGTMGNTMKAFIAYRATAYLSSLAGSFLDSADSMTNMYSRLDILNNGMRSTTEIMSELFAVAERSRGSIESVATLYTRLSAATTSLGTTQQEILDFTELLSDTFILSGASAAEAASGVTQISQAMAKGKLDGDEFKSISENNVYFINLLAESLGVTRGELLRMSKAGEITTEKLIEMGVSVEDTRAKVESMPVTVSQAVTLMDNAWKRMIGSNNALSLAVGKSLKYIANQANDMVATFEKMSETDIETQWQKQRAPLDEMKKAYASTVKEMEAMALGLRAAKDNGVSQDWIDIQNKKVIALGVSASSLLVRMKALRLELGLGQTKGGAVDDKPPPPKSGEPSNRQKALDSYSNSLKSAELQVSLFYDKLTILDNLFFNKQISESVWNEEVEKLTGNLSESAASINLMAEAEERLNSVLQSTMTPTETHVQQMIELSEIMQKYPELADKATEAMQGLNKQFSGDKKENSFIDWGKQAENAIGGVTGAFIDMAISGKNSFEDFAKSFLVNMAKMIAQQMVLNALKSSTVFGGLFASGGVVNNGVQTFATGGVVSSPTIFPMASGIGLVGEAGPEAILPLKRGRNGDLGVQMEGGGGGNVTINQTINGNGDRNLAIAVQQGAQKGYQMFLEDVKRNGPGRRNMGV